MVQVPTYQAGQANQRPATPFNVDANVPLEALGGGQSQANLAQSIGTAGNTIENIYLKERERGRDIATDSYRAKLSSKETANKIEISKYQGLDALDAVENGLSDFDKYYQDLDKGIQDQEVRRRVKLYYQGHRENLNAWGQPYAQGEMRQYESITYRQLIGSEQEAVKKDSSSARIALSIHNQEQATKRHAVRNGLGEEWAQTQIKKLKSVTHANVIKRYLDLKDDQSAQTYYDSVKGELLGDELEWIEPQLKHESTMGNAQRKVDEDFASGKIETESDLRDRWLSIKDPQIRREYLRLGQERLVMEARISRQRVEAAEGRAVRAIEAWESMASDKNFVGPILNPLDVIDSADYQLLDSDKIASIKKRVSAVLKGEEIQTNMEVWTRARMMSQAQLAKLTDAQVYLGFGSHLDETDYKAFVSRVAEAKQHPETFQSIIDEEATVFEGFKDSGLIAKTREFWGLKDFEKEGSRLDQKAHFEFVKKYNTRKLQWYKDHNNTNPGSEDRQKIIDGIALEYNRTIPFIETNLLGFNLKSKGKSIYGLTDSDYRSSKFDIPEEKLDLWYARALNYGLIEEPTSREQFENRFREEINRTFVKLYTGEKNYTESEMVFLYGKTGGK